MDKIPLVSILIVTRNRRRDLVRAIRSALLQDYPRCEVVVVDNASSDGTAEMVRQDFSEVRLICSHKNLGCPSGRNLGFVNCRGKYIFLLDDDGWLEENALDVSVKRAEADESLAVVLSAIHEEDHDAVRIRPEGNVPMYINSFVGCCALIRREALLQVGLFPDDFFRQAEEEDLAIRLLDAGWFCFFEPQSIMYHSQSVVGRDLKAFEYYSIRNTTKTALRLWPFPYNVARVLVNGLHGFRILFTRGDLRTFVRLSMNLFHDVLYLKGKRRPVGIKTLRLFMHLQKYPSRNRPKHYP